jgi:hypothetical protein
VRAAIHGCEPKRCQWKGDLEEVKMDDDGGEDDTAPLAPARSRKRRAPKNSEQDDAVPDLSNGAAERLSPKRRRTLEEEEEDDDDDDEALRLEDVVLCKFAGRKCLGQVVEIREGGSFDVQWWGQNSAPNGRFYPAWLDGDNDEVFLTPRNAGARGLALSWTERLHSDVIIARVEEGVALAAAHDKGQIPAHIKKQVGTNV